METLIHQPEIGYAEFFQIPAVKKELSLAQTNKHARFDDVVAAKKYDECIKRSSIKISELVNRIS